MIHSLTVSASILHRFPAAFGLLFVVAASPPVRAGDAPTVEVLTPGAAPHAALRYRPTVGAVQTVTLTMQTRMTVTVGGSPAPSRVLPELVMGMRLKVTDASKDGFSYSFRLTALKIKRSKGAPAEAAAAMKKALEGFDKISGTASVTPRGFVRSFHLTVPKDTPKPLVEVLGSLEKSMNQITAPLPDAPVGVGARWKVSQTVAQPGLRITNETVVGLVARDGDQIRLTMTITQRGSAEKVATAEKPAAELLGSKGDGSGTSLQNLGRVAPDDVTTRLHTTSRIRAEGNRVVQLGMTLEVRATAK